MNKREGTSTKTILHAILLIVACDLDSRRLWRGPLIAHQQSLRYPLLSYKFLGILEVHVAYYSLSENHIVEALLAHTCAAQKF